MLSNWTLLDLYVQLRLEELRARGPAPVAPPEEDSAIRHRLARTLVGLGLRLDAEASRAALGAFEPAPRLNGSDA